MSETAVSEGSQMELQIISGSNVPVRRDIPATPILVCNVLDPSEANFNGVGCPQGAGPKLLDSQRDHSQESTPAYTVPVRVGNIYVRAVVDTATIISTDIWDMIVPKPKAIGKRAFQMAGKDHRAEALLVGPLPIKVGFLTTSEYCYFSALTDDMLLGVDFLDRHQAVVDFAEHTFTIHGSSITMNNAFPDMVSVSSSEDMTISPRSHVRMSCRASKSVPGLILVGNRFSTSSTPLDIVIPGQDTGAPIGTGFESRYENVGTVNGASSSPEWEVSHKEMRLGMKTCPVRDCGYAGNNIEKHVYVSHLPACLNPILTFTPGQPHLPEEG